MKKIILAFTGPMASGKGTACAYFVEENGATVMKFSTMLRNLLDRLYLPHTRENMQDISTALRKQFGQDLMAKVIARDVEESQSPFIVIDGARRPEDVSYLKKIGGFFLVALETSAETRFQRLRDRRENPDDEGKSWEQFLQDEKAETELTIPQLMKDADFHVDNNGTPEQLHLQLEELFKKLV